MVIAVLIRCCAFQGLQEIVGSIAFGGLRRLGYPPAEATEEEEHDEDADPKASGELLVART